MTGPELNNEQRDALRQALLTTAAAAARAAGQLAGTTSVLEAMRLVLSATDIEECWKR